MLCNGCGYLNKDGAIFCASCGKELKKTPVYKSKRGTWGTGAKMLFVILVLFLCTGGVYFGYRYYQYHSLEKETEIYVGMENYENAVELYEKLIEISHKMEYANRKKEIEELIESKRSFEEAMKAKNDGNITSSLKNLILVSAKDTTRYEIAQKEMSNLGKQYLSNANKEIEQKNFDYALSLIEEYQKILPDSKTAQDLKISLNKKRAIFENEQDQKRREEEARALEEERIASLESTAYELIGTTQTIVTIEANVRSAPRQGNNSVGIIKQGSDVYIMDTKIEDNNRIWCKVRYYDADKMIYVEGWVSYNTMNYSI